jgi:4-amino-4-deoxy-L-arabinose transferase-like glycosyltransferase
MLAGAWLALVLFLLLPGHTLSLVGGLPWGPLGLGCAVLLAAGLYAAWPLAGRPARRWLLALPLLGLALAALKLGLALSAPRYGLEASYFANERFHNEPESSTAAPGLPYTRLDRALDFGGDEFPLFFFNDAERFNSLGPDRQDRGRSLTWSVRWQGYLQAPADGPATIWLTASGPADLALDGRSLLKVDEDGRTTAQARVNLTGGGHALRVRYARKKERSGYLQVQTDLEGQRQVLGAPLITAERETAERLAADLTAARLARGVDLAFLALLGLTVPLAVGLGLRQRLAAAPAALGGRWAALERPLLAALLLGFFLQAALPRLDRYGKMVFLGGGQDWLTHEGLARDIQFNGPLMTLGKPLGEGALYYAQPLYPYYLALLHTLAGEDLFGVTALQVLGLGVGLVLIYELARRLFGRPTALVALALLLGILVPFELAWVARLLISEALYYWVMPAAVLALVALAGARSQSGEPMAAVGRGLAVAAESSAAFRSRSTSAGEPVPSVRNGRSQPAGQPYLLALLAGLLLGLACLTRGPTLLYLPPALLLLWLGLREARPAPAAGRLVALVALGAGLLIALVPLRNWVVAGQPALTASSGGVNLQKLHRPSDQVRLGGVDDDPFYAWLGADRPTRETLEYLRQDPAGYFGSYLPLAAYALGVGSALNDLLDERPVQLQPELLALNALYALYLLGLGRTLGGRSGPGRSGLVAGRGRAGPAPTTFVHAFVAVHLLTMVVFAPYDYENRLVTPMYLFVPIFSAAALVGLGRLVRARVGSGARRDRPWPAAAGSERA